MILINEPYSVYERQLEKERRRQAALCGLRVFLFCLGCIALGIFIGCLIRF